MRLNKLSIDIKLALKINPPTSIGWGVFDDGKPLFHTTPQSQFKPFRFEIYKAPTRYCVLDSATLFMGRA